ncbi:MAG: flippase-like domain-containing protein [Deltaproteobacteria bacterium]|nr:flippase-like domain-containing protein [Deltaproteobacteria bacterium]
MRWTSRHTLFALQILISTTFVYLLLRRTDVAAIAAHVASANFALLALSLVTKLAGMLLMALRLERVSRSSARLDFSRAFRAQSIAFVGNNLLPLRLGEALKIGFMTRSGSASATACIGFAALERILDSVFLVLFIAAGLLLFPRVVPGSSALALFCAIAVSGLVVLFLAARFPDRLARLVAAVSRPLGERMATRLVEHAAQFARGVSALASLRVFATLVALTAGYWISSALSVYIWLHACGIEVPWYAAIVVLVFVSLATVIPAAPGFVGTYHYFAVLALGLFDVESAAATSFSIVGHAVAFVPFTLLLSPLVARDILALLGAGLARPPRAADRGANDGPDADHAGATADARVPLI